MASIASVSKTIVIRTSRETVALAVVASLVTFAMAYVVHGKHDGRLPAQAAAPAAPVAQELMPKEDWAGHLSEVTPAETPAAAEPMTSASLTVPKAQLALPMPMVPKVVPKQRPCVEPQPCALKTLAASSIPVQAHRQTAAAEKAQAARPHRSLVGMLNPLNHLPDMSTMSRPFTYAGGAVAGWFKRL